MNMHIWFCYFNSCTWAMGETPQEAYDSMCAEEGEDISAEDCAFYKMQNVRITPPSRPIIEEI